jgi:hypothetical protein
MVGFPGVVLPRDGQNPAAPKTKVAAPSTEG